MKMNIKGLVFVGFAAAVFASAANAADKTVTSKTYVDTKYVGGTGIEVVDGTDQQAGKKVIRFTGDVTGEPNVQANWAETDESSDSYIQNKPELAPVATSGDYNDLSNTPTIPDVYNATLTVKQGTDTLGTFTANSNTPTEIDIPVPTAPNNSTITIYKSDGTTQVGSFTVDQATAGSINLPEIPAAANNSTITIYKSDGTTQVGSFTVDQATAGSINLPADSDTIYTFDEGAVAGQFKYSTDGGSTWTQVTVHNAQVTDNMVQTINSSSTSTTYPSAEAVYNFLSTPPTGVTCSDAAPCAFVLGSGAPEWRPIQQ